jgi:hypothetical protein
MSGIVPVRADSALGTGLPCLWPVATIRIGIASYVPRHPIQPSCPLDRFCTHTGQMSVLSEDIRRRGFRNRCWHLRGLSGSDTLCTLGVDVSWNASLGVFAGSGTELPLCVHVDGYRPDCEIHEECEGKHESQDVFRICCYVLSVRVCLDCFPYVPRQPLSPVFFLIGPMSRCCGNVRCAQ